MLKLNKINLAYEDTKVFENVSMEFQAGEINVITGNSGCGKSSLVRMINGIIPYFTKADITGEILFNGENILNKDITSRSKFISTVFQNPKSQFFAVNSFDEIAFALENRKIPRQDIINQISDYSKLLNTEYLLNKDIFKLSGGERQMVAITGVAVMNSDIYIFDEPSSSLDMKYIEQLKNALIKLKQMGKIVIVAEHRLFFLKDIMDNIHVLKDKTVHSIPKEEITQECIQEFGLRSLNEIKKEELKNENYIIQKLHNLCYKNQELNLENYVFKYNKENEIFNMNMGLGKGVNFIIGENGVGKSTFLRCLCGLNKKFHGKTFYKGNLLKKNYDNISLVMQDVNYQLFTESVWEELSIVSDDDVQKEEVLKELELWDKKEAHPQSLSGGEKQRLLIAGAILSQKPIVVLDEPTSGLCKKTMNKVLNLLKKLEEKGKLVIVVTHDYEFIKNYNGKVIEFIK